MKWDSPPDIKNQAIAEIPASSVPSSKTSSSALFSHAGCGLGCVGRREAVGVGRCQQDRACPQGDVVALPLGTVGQPHGPSAPRTGAATLTLKPQSKCGPRNSSTRLQPLPLCTGSLGWWDADHLESSALVQETLRVLRGGRTPRNASEKCASG